jgi:hypothetical protein
VRAPAIGVDLLIFISKERLARPHDADTAERTSEAVNGGSRQSGEEEFLNDARTCEANGTLLKALGMGGYHHAAQRARRSHRYRLPQS